MNKLSWGERNDNNNAKALIPTKEVEEAMKKMKQKKVMSVNGIPIATWKSWGDEIEFAYRLLLQEIYKLEKQRGYLIVVIIGRIDLITHAMKLWESFVKSRGLLIYANVQGELKGL